MKAIFAVMNTTWAVVAEVRLENSMIIALRYDITLNQSEIVPYHDHQQLLWSNYKSSKYSFNHNMKKHQK